MSVSYSIFSLHKFMLIMYDDCKFSIFSFQRFISHWDAIGVDLCLSMICVVWEDRDNFVFNDVSSYCESIQARLSMLSSMQLHTSQHQQLWLFVVLWGVASFSGEHCVFHFNFNDYGDLVSTFDYFEFSVVQHS